MAFVLGDFFLAHPMTRACLPLCQGHQCGGHQKKEEEILDGKNGQKSAEREREREKKGRREEREREGERRERVGERRETCFAIVNIKLSGFIPGHEANIGLQLMKMPIEILSVGDITANKPSGRTFLRQNNKNRFSLSFPLSRIDFYGTRCLYCQTNRHKHKKILHLL